MRWTAWRRYRHMSCLDIDVVVLKVHYRHPLYTKLRVSYFLQNGTALNQTESVLIRRSDEWKWKCVE